MNSFSKNERLCSQELLGELMRSGESFIAYPFRVVYRISKEPSDVPVRMAISVGKKRFKRAVKRNYIKRLAREAYRTQKSELYACLQSYTTLDLLLIYLDQELPTYERVEKSMGKLREKLQKRLNCSVVDDENSKQISIQ